MRREIILKVEDTEYRIPNNWECMSPAQFLRLTSDLLLMAAGSMSPGEVRINWLCDIMHWKKSKFNDEELIENLVSIAEQVTFLFLINYPNKNEILDGLEDEIYETCRRIDPYNLTIPMGRVLRKLDYQYKIDLCFCAQLLPTVTVNNEKIKGYTIDTSFGALTCSLKTLQYIEAMDSLNQGNDALPLLASILYFPFDKYDSEVAHAMAKEFKNLPANVLTAIAFNFQAFNNFLFSKTQFSLLGKIEAKKDLLIATDASDALYDLSKEGLGNVSQIEQMNVLTYFRILRKKTIDAVRDFSGMGLDVVEISNKVGLPINVINKIV